jgi:hypothetical protein
MDVSAEDSVKFRVWNYPVKEQYSVIVSKARDIQLANYRDGIDRVTIRLFCLKLMKIKMQ